MSGIPFLPGSAARPVVKTSHAKSHVFDYRNGYGTVAKNTDNFYLGANVSALANAATGGTGKLKLTSFPDRPEQKPLETVPSWIAYDRMVLRFYGYFQEAVHERPTEAYRIRKCVILYYLEDDSIYVAEPKQENSGMPQGAFIKRHRIPKGRTGEFYTIHDLNLGREVTFYGRTFRIVDCDQFTADYFTSQDMPLAAAEEFPADPYSSSITTSKAGRTTTKSASDMSKLRQFLVNDRQVLRFYCTWDNREAMFGDVRPFTLNYFLADDTVEVHEVYEQNCGRDPFPALLKRNKLPKSNPGVMAPTETEYYTPADFAQLGTIINVYGRAVMLRDCDDFTRQFYRERFGITHMEPVPLTAPAKQDIKMPLPPYNGFGTEEDSLGSFLTLVPKAPKKDLHRFMLNDRKILRFAARLDSLRPEDMGRRFIISFYLADDTIGVFETPMSNSGIWGGKFLERGKVKKPNSTETYEAPDFVVGAVLEFYRHRFILYDADEYTYSFLQAPPEIRITVIHAKIGPMLLDNEYTIREAYRFADQNEPGANANSGRVSWEHFLNVLHKFHVSLTRQEKEILQRFWDPSGEGVDYVEFCDVIFNKYINEQAPSRVAPSQDSEHLPGGTAFVAGSRV